MKYLIIKYIQTPDKKFKEQATVSTSLRPRDVDGAAVILDYSTRTVVKAVIDGKTLPRAFDRLSTYYREFFPAVIGRLENENRVNGPDTPKV